MRARNNAEKLLDEISVMRLETKDSAYSWFSVRLPSIGCLEVLV